MKKLLVVLCVLALSSLANATVLTWQLNGLAVTEINLNVGESATLLLIADDAVGYDAKWVGTYDSTGVGSTITSLIKLSNAGSDGKVTAVTGDYAGWYTVEALDSSAPFDSVHAGAQFEVTIQALANGTYLYSSDADTDNDSQLTVIVPEPATIALLCLGGLLIRKK